jgi:histidinol-phosphate aminotransferase
MTYQLPEKLRTLEPYQPITGQIPVRLDANESFLSLPDEIRHEIAVRVSRIDFNRYPDPYAVELCQKFGKHFNVPSELIVAANGSDELLFLLTTCFADAGDKLMVVKPDFSMYQVYAELAGMQVEVFNKDESFEIGVDDLIAAAKEKNVKMLLFSNPCNPTSLIASKEDVLKIVEALEDVLVVVDEAYMEFADGTVLQEVGNYGNLMVLKTFSKAFGLAAARLGFAVSNQTIINALKAAKSPYNVNTMSQVVGCILLDHPAYLEECELLIKESRDYLFGMLQAMAGSQPKIKSIQNTRSNFVYMEVEGAAGAYKALQQQGIAIRLMGNYLRICAGSKEENAAVLQALGDYLKGAN